MDWEKIKLGSWSALGGAALLATVGFNYGGWVTSGTAAAMAKEIAADAVAERLGTICVAQFNRDSDKGEKLKEMKGKDTWDKAATSKSRAGRSCLVKISPMAKLPTHAPSILRIKRKTHG